MDNDHAVAPVVAAMLLLVVVVMFLSVYNTVIIPSFKQQAEVEHLFAVEESFLSFGSDMTTAAALKQDLHLSKRIPLGGGETIFDPVRSGGTLRVGGGDTIATVTLNWTTHYCCNLTGFSYTPISNFWRDQGYTWQYGYTNVTGRGGLETPLDYPTMEEVCSEANSSRFAASFIGIEHNGRFSDGNHNCTDNNCTDIRITLVTFDPDEMHYFTSGNGIGTLSLDTLVEDILIAPPPETIVIAVNTSLPVPLNTSLWLKCNETFHTMNETYTNIETCTPSSGGGWDQVTLKFAGGSAPEVAPEVTLRLIRVSVSAR